MIPLLAFSTSSLNSIPNRSSGDDDDNTSSQSDEFDLIELKARLMLVILQHTEFSRSALPTVLSHHGSSSTTTSDEKQAHTGSPSHLPTMHDLAYERQNLTAAVRSLLLAVHANRLPLKARVMDPRSEHQMPIPAGGGAAAVRAARNEVEAEADGKYSSPVPTRLINAEPSPVAFRRPPSTK